MEQDNVHLILGNHEAMMLSCAFLFEEVTDSALDSLTAESMDCVNTWLQNGAQPTLSALRVLHRRAPMAVMDIFDALRDAPLFEVVCAGGRDFLLTHAAPGGFRKDKPLSAYTPDELLYTRPSPQDRYFERTYTVFGHTPTAFFGAEYAGRIFFTPTWADIDTGAAMGGMPALLRLEDMRAFYAADA